jgi:hypothetical protein
MATHRNILNQDLENSIDIIRCQTIQATTTYETKMKEVTREIDKFINTISDTEISAISRINSTASTRKEELIKLNNKLSKLIEMLQATKTNGTQASKDVHNATIVLKKNIRQNYDNIEEFLENQVDTQKDQFCNWMSTLVEHPSPNMIFRKELKEMNKELEDERELLQAERILFQQKQIELEHLIANYDQIKTSPSMKASLIPSQYQCKTLPIPHQVPTF